MVGVFSVRGVEAPPSVVTDTGTSPENDMEAITRILSMDQLVYSVAGVVPKVTNEDPCESPNPVPLIATSEARLVAVGDDPLRFAAFNRDDMDVQHSTVCVFNEFVTYECNART